MITPTNPLSFKLRSTFLTGAGFAIPGTAMTYKLFVRLTTGNESGS